MPVALGAAVNEDDDAALAANALVADEDVDGFTAALDADTDEDRLAGTLGFFGGARVDAESDDEAAPLGAPPPTGPAATLRYRRIMGVMGAVKL